jgi:hypothetical protein
VEARESPFGLFLKRPPQPRFRSGVKAARKLFFF